MAWVKKTTKVYKDGKLVNTIEENMTESKYRKDLTKRIAGNQFSGHKTRLFLGLSQDVEEGKISGMRTTSYTTLGGKPVKYVYDSTYRYAKPRKRRKK